MKHPFHPILRFAVPASVLAAAVMVLTAWVGG
jgi:hypothetical protein